jgi:NAD(P)-dependent dehydrogenase (short-subunit alcohol dehydrogenase family)
MRLQDKVVFISGAGSGIGRACALLFAQHGARVAIAEIDEGIGTTTRDDVLAASPDQALFVQTDVTNEASVEQAMRAVSDHFGKIDVLVNCAGGSLASDASVTDVDMSVWDHTIDLDLKGPFLCCRIGIPYLQQAGGGSIVNFTSVVALKGAFGGHVYTAAKGGIISLTQALAGRYWRDGIRANAIAPGIVLSERVGGRMQVDPLDTPEQQIASAMQLESRLVDHRHPFGYGMPEDIANVALFLASDESRMVNSAVIPAEGGAAHY